MSEPAPALAVGQAITSAEQRARLPIGAVVVSQTEASRYYTVIAKDGKALLEHREGLVYTLSQLPIDGTYSIKELPTTLTVSQLKPGQVIRLVRRGAPGWYSDIKLGDSVKVKAIAGVVVLSTLDGSTIGAIIRNDEHAACWSLVDKQEQAVPQTTPALKFDELKDGALVKFIGDNGHSYEGLVRGYIYVVRHYDDERFDIFTITGTNTKRCIRNDKTHLRCFTFEREPPQKTADLYTSLKISSVAQLEACPTGTVLAPRNQAYKLTKDAAGLWAQSGTPIATHLLSLALGHYNTIESLPAGDALKEVRQENAPPARLILTATAGITMTGVVPPRLKLKDLVGIEHVRFKGSTNGQYKKLTTNGVYHIERVGDTMVFKIPNTGHIIADDAQASLFERG